MGCTPLFRQSILAVIAIATLAQCGNKKSKTSDIDVTVLPEKPIVITADVQGGGGTYKGPWFSYYLSLKNGSDETFTIVAIEAEISGLDAAGQMQTKIKAWSPGEYDGPHLGKDQPACTYTTFGTWTAGQEKAVALTGAVAGCPTVPSFTVDNNPRGPNNSFRYRIKLKPLGWFGTFAAPTDRFEKFKYFFTQ